MEDSLKIQARSVILKEGEIASHLYIVKSGEIICLKFSKDRLIPVFLARAGDIIGESVLTVAGTYTYSAISFSNAEVIRVPSTNFLKTLEKAPDWLRNLTETMMNRLQVTSNLVAENRIISPVIIDGEKFSDAFEIDCRKLLENTK